MLAYVIQVVGFCELKIASTGEILTIEEAGEEEVSEKSLIRLWKWSNS